MKTQEWLALTRLTVVVGHFGSGKTEFSVNLALRLAIHIVSPFNI